MSSVVYCVDTSSLLEVWARTYPIDIFPRVWADIEELASNERIRSPELVRDELEKHDDELTKWVKDRPYLFVPFNEEQESYLIEIMDQYPFLAKGTKRKYGADPFVIALAKTEGLVVVTEEQFGGSNKPKIPDVCKQEGVKCLSVLDMMRREEWSY